MTPASRSRNSVEASTNTQRQLQPLEALADLRRFVQPQHAVVDEDARQPVADRAVDDERRDRRVDAAAQRADDPPVADLRADPRRRLFDKRRHRPVAGAAADAVREVAQDLEAALGVHDFRVEQQRVEPRARRPPSPRPARWRSSRRPRSRPARRRRSRRGWPRRESRPARRRRAAARSPIARRSIDGRMAELALRRRRDRAAERVRHQLHAVADAEHRACPRSNSAGIALRRARVRHALRTARQDDAGRLARANLVGRRVRRPDLRVDRQLAQTPRDELRVLRSEIENDDGLMAHERALRTRGWKIRRYYSGVRTARHHNML